MLFIGISVGGWTDMIKGWEIKEYQGIGAIEFPVYIVRTVIIFASIMIVFIYASLIFNEFKKKIIKPECFMEIDLNILMLITLFGMLLSNFCWAFI